MDFNKLLKDNSEINNVTIIDNSKMINTKQKNINCFHIDNVHLNPIGYEIMLKEIQNYIK